MREGQSQTQALRRVTGDVSSQRFPARGEAPPGTGRDCPAEGTLLKSVLLSVVQRWDFIILGAARCPVLMSLRGRGKDERSSRKVKAMKGLRRRCRRAGLGIMKTSAERFREERSREEWTDHSFH